MYADTKPCEVCGSAVELEARDGTDPIAQKDPDGTVDKRVCTNADCASNLCTAGHC